MCLCKVIIKNSVDKLSDIACCDENDYISRYVKTIAAFLSSSFQVDEAKSGLFWLPLSHDMTLNFVST